MNGREIFRILVATGGLVLFCMGIVSLIEALAYTVTMTEMMGEGGGQFYGFMGAVQIVVGAVIMRSSESLSGIAFREELIADDPTDIEWDEAGGKPTSGAGS